MGDLVEHGSFKNLEHHLSTEARKRLPNPMKSIWMVAFGRPDLVSLANGDPDSSFYPISEVSFTVPSIEKDVDLVEGWVSGQLPTQKITSYKDQECAIKLKTAFQYGAGAGLQETREILKKLNDLLHSSSNHEVTLSLGNADALTKCFRLLGDPGDSFLVEEFSFPAMTNAPLVQGIQWVPVQMDKEGLIPEVMESILKNWSEETQGKRPHVLYTIPSGQNPTGSTLKLGRRKRIYEIACEWDIIILEDDPYYFLQYDRPQVRSETIEQDGFAKTLLNTLAPSFLSLDTEGRVIRLDTFSKIIVPGMRLGWITSNPMFAQRMALLVDSSTQHPHGLGQAFVTEMLNENGWGLDGYIRWVSSLCDSYQRRRDLLIDRFRSGVRDSGVASVDSPEAGMFVWIQVHFEKHPRYETVTTLSDEQAAKGQPRTNIEALSDELFQFLMEKGVIVMPAKVFAVDTPPGWKVEGITIKDRINFYRATFAGTNEVIVAGIDRTTKGLKEFFGLVEAN